MPFEPRRPSQILPGGGHLSILIRKEGILTTVQDLGRAGYRRLGINPGGVMDTFAARSINLLAGNPESEGVLEMHFPACTIEFEKGALFVVGGGDFGAEIDGDAIENWRPHLASKGSVLEFKRKRRGNRAYFAVRGGFKLGKWLGSVSTYLAAGLGGFEGRKMKKGDRLFLNATEAASPSSNLRLSTFFVPRYPSFPTVRITPGAEFDKLTAFAQETLLKTSFTITRDSNRMGYRLEGGPLYLLNDLALVSSAVNFGTVQLLPDGQMIVLMADHQTSGGYPRLGNVVSVDLPLLAQLGPNDKVAFHLVTLEEAEELAIRFERDMNLLKTACLF